MAPQNRLTASFLRDATTAPAPQAEAPLLRVNDLSVAYEKQAVVHNVGFELGRGKSLAEVMAARKSVAEGVTTAPAVLALARGLGIDMPIAAAVDRILHHGSSLGAEADAMHSYLETAYNDGRDYVLHYVTAREMYNIVKAAEAGKSGNPAAYRDYELAPPAASWAGHRAERAARVVESVR